MHRRNLILAGSVLPVLLASTATRASEKDVPEEGASINVSGVGVPIIVDEKIVNYVFVTVKLFLGKDQTSETMRAKEAFFRDALVRASHRTSMGVPGDWTRVNEGKINAAMMAAAIVIVGRGAVIRSQVFQQTPRRRTGMPQG